MTSFIEESLKNKSPYKLFLIIFSVFVNVENDTFFAQKSSNKIDIKFVKIIEKKFVKEPKLHNFSNQIQWS